MERAFRGMLFRVAQAAMAPVAIVAYPAFVWRLLRRSRVAGVSATVAASLYTRYMQHHLGTRSDDPAARLLAALPGVPRTALAMVTAPTLLAHRITGHVPRLYRYPYTGPPPLAHQPAARTTFYDAALAREMGGVRQLVVLGAGLDTRADLLPRGGRLRCFEVDRAPTQALKLDLMRRVGLDPNRTIRVSVDFRTDDWFERLTRAGFDPALPTFYLWEAVTMYLDPRTVEATLERVAAAAPGSVLAFDYFSAATIGSRDPLMAYARAAARCAGEPLTYGLETAPPSREAVSRFLEARGLVLREHRTFGRESAGRAAPAGFVVAAVPEGSGRRIEG